MIVSSPEQEGVLGRRTSGRLGRDMGVTIVRPANAMTSKALGGGPVRLRPLSACDVLLAGSNAMHQPTQGNVSYRRIALQNYLQNCSAKGRFKIALSTAMYIQKRAHRWILFSPTMRARASVGPHVGTISGGLLGLAGTVDMNAVKVTHTESAKPRRRTAGIPAASSGFLR